MAAETGGPRLERATLRTSRLLDFCSEKELIAQTGHRPEAWPLVVVKELVDNSLDACEEGRVPPKVEIRVGDDGITVSDNGPGIPESTVESILDFSIRVSSREAYVAPDRGAQGNALKTRQDGGKPQRFCSTEHRQAFNHALRAWALRQWEGGQITPAQLRAADET